MMLRSHCTQPPIKKRKKLHIRALYQRQYGTLLLEALCTLLLFSVVGVSMLHGSHLWRQLQTQILWRTRATQLAESLAEAAQTRYPPEQLRQQLEKLAGYWLPKPRVNILPLQEGQRWVVIAWESTTAVTHEWDCRRLVHAAAASNVQKTEQCIALAIGA